jgi:hypothetical protein
MHQLELQFQAVVAELNSLLFCDESDKLLLSSTLIKLAISLFF